MLEQEEMEVGLLVKEVFDGPTEAVLQLSLIHISEPTRLLSIADAGARSTST